MKFIKREVKKPLKFLALLPVLTFTIFYLSIFKSNKESNPIIGLLLVVFDIIKDIGIVWWLCSGEVAGEF